MNLDNTILDSLKSNPVESANRSIVSGMGRQYDIVATPILNLNPHQQVALQQVNARIPQPIFHYDSSKPLPTRTWVYNNWVIDFEDGVMTVTKKVEKPYLYFFLRTEREVIEKIQGRDVHQRFLRWMTDSSMSRDAKAFFRTAMVHHANSQEKVRHAKSRLGKTVLQPIHTASDMVAQIEPTGMVGTDFHDTGFDWSTSVESLPDF